MNANKVVLKIVSISFSMLLVILLAVGLYQGGKIAYGFGYRVFTESPIDLPEEGKDKVVQVAPGMGGRELGGLLQKKGLIRDANLFFIQLKLSAYSKTIKEGTYTLSTSMTAQEMMQVMSAEETEDTKEDGTKTKNKEAEKGGTGTKDKEEKVGGTGTKDRETKE